MSKILWGVCGIGHGHIFRQLPLIEYFAQDNDIVIFGYGESYDFYRKRFADNPRVQVYPVAVPFYPGGDDGIDFKAAEDLAENGQDYVAINGAAMAAAKKILGKPDLVVSDYEPISAQYAYAMNAPLVTVDQQSKYLCGDFPAVLNGQNFIDEVQRLRMFFPRAHMRLASTFFHVAAKDQMEEDVTLCPPVLGDEILKLQRKKSTEKEILIYLSSQRPFGQGFEEIAQICSSQPDVKFHLFGKNIPQLDAVNAQVYQHGDKKFHEVLSRCHGVICTAGHTLLSEAMHLQIPVYAIPLALYEQEMNAYAVAQGGFGVSSPRFEERVLACFLRNLPDYEAAIKNDRTRLLRGPGQDDIIGHLKSAMVPQ